MIDVLIAVGILFAVGIVCAVVLALASYYMSVPVDEKASALRDCLPGANCGACGYTGCDGYAEALAKGEAAPNLCIPGGTSAAEGIAKILGVEILDEAMHSCRVTVPEDQLSLAIGNKGQNARLAAKLTGWKIDINPETEEPVINFDD